MQVGRSTSVCVGTSIGNEIRRPAGLNTVCRASEGRHRGAQLDQEALIRDQHAPPGLHLARRGVLASAALLLIAGQQAALPSLPAASAEAEAETGSAAAAQPISKVFVAGATGQTGRRVVRELRARGFSVVAGVRNPEKAVALGFGADPGIEIREADVTQGVDLLKAAIGDCQAVVSALGYNGGSDAQGFAAVDGQGTADLISAAAAAGGVRRFVLETSALTGSSEGKGLLASLAYRALNSGTQVLDRKQEAEAALKAAAAGGAFDYVIVRPGGLVNDPPEQVGVPTYGQADSVSGPQRVSRDSVAELMAAAVTEPAAANKTVEIASSKGASTVPQGPAWFP